MAIKELKSVVLGSEQLGNNAIIGTFEGKCADGLVTNANNMDIPTEVWTTLFNSDSYKQAIKLGWYIGFLGHPEDPNCMDFKNACIVMTEGHIDDNGEVYGKFNLIDTPVGRIVKSFIDAGVTFGISVRGVGDTISNGISESVDPDSFIFRGFDIVTFPAFEDAIPKFQALAASTNIENQVKYKKICASIDANLPDITSPIAIETIQEQFSPNSAEYAKLMDRKAELEGSLGGETSEDVDQKKFEGMFELYKEAQETIQHLQSEIKESQEQLLNAQIECEHLNKKTRIFESTLNHQSAAMHKITAQSEATKKALIEANAKIKSENCRLVSGQEMLRNKNTQLKEVVASQKIAIEDAQKTNLKYSREIKSATQTIESNSDTISEQEKVISDLRSQLRETVKQQKIEAAKSLDRNDEYENLKSEITRVNKILAGYQSAYVDLYQSVSGVDLSNIPITASTSVDDLHKVINQRTGVPIMASCDVDDQVIYDDLSDDCIVSL